MLPDPQEVIYFEMRIPFNKIGNFYKTPSFCNYGDTCDMTPEFSEWWETHPNNPIQTTCIAGVGSYVQYLFTDSDAAAQFKLTWL